MIGLRRGTCSLCSFKDAARLLDDFAGKSVALVNAGGEVLALSHSGEECSDKGVTGAVSVNNSVRVNWSDVDKLDSCLLAWLAGSNNSGLSALRDDDDTRTAG